MEVLVYKPIVKQKYSTRLPEIPEDRCCVFEEDCTASVKPAALNGMDRGFLG